MKTRNKVQTTSTIAIKQYNPDTKKTETITEVSGYHLALYMSPYDFAYILDKYFTFGNKEFPEGVDIGKRLRDSHRMTQACAVNFILGIISGISEQYCTDEHNATAIDTAKKIAAMVESGQLKLTDIYKVKSKIVKEN